MLNFTHTYLYFKDLIKTDFCEIYVILWDLIEVKNPSFQSLKCLTWLSAGRQDRSTVAEVGRPTCTGRARSPGWEAGRPGRSTAREFLLSGNGPGRPVDCSALCFQFSVDRSVDRWINGHNYDRWPVDRPVNRKGSFALY